MRAAWLGGSAAFGRLDDLSDIDIQFDVGRGEVDATFALIERVLTTLAPLEYKWVVPEPTWHGHAQRFYRLEGTSRHLFIDVVVMNHLQGPRFNEVERHGEPIVLFDKDGVVATASLDREAHLEEIRGALGALGDKLALGRSVVEKEIARGNALDAIAFYQRFIIDPLVVMLRVKYLPERYDFGLRYAHLDLPEEAAGALETLCFVADFEDLARKFETASSLIESLVNELWTEEEARPPLR